MILFPAIDLKGGQVVRLFKGEMAQATVYGEDPAAQAAAFRDAGFQWLHLVDLDGAFAGEPRNAGAVEALLARVALPVQLGGGIRDLATVERWLALGVRRVILGTAAVRDPDFVREACRRHPGRIVVGVDARDGRVAVAGWAEASELTALELAKRFADAGVAALLFTDVSRDGALAGVNLEATAALARDSGLPVLASGGVAGIADIEGLLALKEPLIEGVVIGRALYDGRLDAAAALALAREAA
ncbi:1-(5-phosphoribosyl)-5-[(5-phosphoribosylamino)methylideneamino]imidazole-4-carboxamide isomerase [Thalassobaculum salexigens]|uniref:1-(5-phosphoribosyl)-5-[(5- phosphoribosylamino)methylideneamino]imidazole-4- carboxamide isomerase n=1 Tax=Thalassobaculum salexigens TaxID=455360 RepID=UPI00248F173D|nr:1-(5-phosphoribosyl)-5-[(5-phosphoribosylamino)methylideneamino]imidazole-4-carboxamide isomerase [Thalassobaculum salexigens]